MSATADYSLRAKLPTGVRCRVSSTNLKNDEAMARAGEQRDREKIS